jgi:hypothetical protein
MNTKRLKQTFWYGGKKYRLIHTYGWKLLDKYNNHFAIHLKDKNHHLCQHALAAFTPDDYLIALVAKWDRANFRIDRYFIKAGILEITKYNKVKFVEKYSADITDIYRKFFDSHKREPFFNELDGLETLYESESKCVCIIERKNFILLFWKMDDPSSFILESLLDTHSLLFGFHVVPNTLKILGDDKIGMTIERVDKSENAKKYNLVYDLTLKTIIALELERTDNSRQYSEKDVKQP